LSTLHKIK